MCSLIKILDNAPLSIPLTVIYTIENYEHLNDLPKASLFVWPKTDVIDKPEKTEENNTNNPNQYNIQPKENINDWRNEASNLKKGNNKIEKYP